jgi:mannose-6-phosphate isomerase-like protein (cupin superfamily)
MKGFVDDIEELTEDNDDFRRVLYTGRHLQLVLMALEPGEEIGEEVHDDGDQFLPRRGRAKGQVMIDGVEQTRTRTTTRRSSSPPARSHNVHQHRFRARLKLYTVVRGLPSTARQAPCRRTKADVREEHFDGKTTE